MSRWEDRRSKELLDWSYTNDDGIIVKVDSKDNVREKAATTKAVFRAMGTNKRRVIFSNLVLGMDKLWHMVVRASRDFGVSTTDPAFPSMNELQSIVGIPALASPARLSRVLHLNGWLDYAGVNLRWYALKYENPRTIWGEEATADGKRTLCACIGRCELVMTIFLDESFRGSLSSWQELVRGEFHKNSDGALRQEFERMMESVLGEICERAYPNPPYADLDISTAPGVARLVRHRAEDRMASLRAHLTCTEPDTAQLRPSPPSVGSFPHSAFFLYTFPELHKTEFKPAVMDPEACGLARPTAYHTSVMRVDMTATGGMQAQEYPGAQGYSTPTRTHTPHNPTQATKGLCPWRVMEVMQVMGHNNTVYQCKRQDCKGDHAIATQVDVTTKVTAADVANFPLAESLKESLRLAIRKIAPSW